MSIASCANQIQYLISVKNWTNSTPTEILFQRKKERKKGILLHFFPLLVEVGNPFLKLKKNYIYNPITLKSPNVYRNDQQQHRSFPHYLRPTRHSHSPGIESTTMGPSAWRTWYFSSGQGGTWPSATLPSLLPNQPCTRLGWGQRAPPPPPKSWVQNLRWHQKLSIILIL